MSIASKRFWGGLLVFGPPILATSMFYSCPEWLSVVPFVGDDEALNATLHLFTPDCPRQKVPAVALSDAFKACAPSVGDVRKDRSALWAPGRRLLAFAAPDPVLLPTVAAPSDCAPPAAPPAVDAAAEAGAVAGAELVETASPAASGCAAQSALDQAQDAWDSQPRDLDAVEDHLKKAIEELSADPDNEALHAVRFDLAVVRAQRQDSAALSSFNECDAADPATKLGVATEMWRTLERAQQPGADRDVKEQIGAKLFDALMSVADRAAKLDTARARRLRVQASIGAAAAALEFRLASCVRSRTSASRKVAPNQALAFESCLTTLIAGGAPPDFGNNLRRVEAVPPVIEAILFAELALRTLGPSCDEKGTWKDTQLDECFAATLVATAAYVEAGDAKWSCEGGRAPLDRAAELSARAVEKTAEKSAERTLAKAIHGEIALRRSAEAREVVNLLAEPSWLCSEERAAALRTAYARAGCETFAAEVLAGRAPIVRLWTGKPIPAPSMFQGPPLRRRVLREWAERSREQPSEPEQADELWRHAMDMCALDENAVAELRAAVEKLDAVEREADARRYAGIPLWSLVTLLPLLWVGAVIYRHVKRLKAD